MPHTHSRYQQDHGFSDGIIVYGPARVQTSGTNVAVLTNNNTNAAGDWSWNNQADTTAINLDVCLGSGIIFRTGFFEDTQNQFGSTFGAGLGSGSSGAAGPSGNAGSGIPASAEVQGRPGAFFGPTGPLYEGTLAEITPRTLLKVKGITINSIAVIYSITTNALTAHTCQLDQSSLVNGAALPLAPTNILANGANGLTTAVSATLVVVEVPMPASFQVYQVADLQEYWFRTIATPSAAEANDYKFYGLRAKVTFNFN